MRDDALTCALTPRGKSPLIVLWQFSGRPPRYCPGKPCAAEAKAARLRDGHNAVDERLARLLEWDERHTPVLREQLRLVTELRESLLARNTDLEEAVKQADEQAAAAETRAGAAEKTAETAITDGRKAVEEAVATQQRAEASEREAWRAVGEHKAGRVDAERAAEAAKRAAERAVAEAAKERQRTATAAAEQQRTIDEQKQKIDALEGEVAGRDTALAAAEEKHAAAAEEARIEISRLRADLAAAIARTEAADTSRDRALAMAEKAHATTDAVRTELSAQLADLRAELAGHAQAVRHAHGERDEARAATAIAEARAEALADRARRGDRLVDQLIAPLPPLEDLDGTPGILLENGNAVLAEKGMVALPGGYPARQGPSAARALAAALQAVSLRLDRAGDEPLGTLAPPGGAAAESP
ncbi:hypothetical protein [Streptosporangium sp. V21-05]|uniref:hypothetical protein n=1 Tax=Streptosporangium sp. V21-05 TaxID=3446115 RepID=UPI003F5345A8